MHPFTSSAIQNWSAPIDKFNLTARIMRTYLRLNLPSRPQAWLKLMDTSPNVFHYRPSEGYLGVVDVLYHQNTEQSHQPALALITTLHHICETFGMNGIRIQVYCLQALILLAGENHTLLSWQNWQYLYPVGGDIG